MNWAGWTSDFKTSALGQKVAHLRDRVRPILTSREGRVGVIGGTLFAAAGVAAFQSPVLAEGCYLPSSLSLAEVRDARVTAAGQAVDGSVVDVVTTARGRVEHIVISYESQGEAGSFLRTVALRPSQIDICTSGSEARADVALTRAQLDSLRDVVIGMTAAMPASVDGTPALRNVTALYHPSELSLVALADWHKAEGSDDVEFRLYKVSDGLRVAAVMAGDAGGDIETADSRPRAFSEIARPAHSLNQVSFAI
ncbi:hypothetical protein [Pyruvatibacter mobilis]|uniref:hypothetical protein n=1 Tax=Pyruvatibacter mobilis TaxID=1712261 RepID=UPI003C7C8592